MLKVVSFSKEVIEAVRRRVEQMNVPCVCDVLADMKNTLRVIFDTSSDRQMLQQYSILKKSRCNINVRHDEIQVPEEVSELLEIDMGHPIEQWSLTDLLQSLQKGVDVREDFMRQLAKRCVSLCSLLLKLTQSLLSKSEACRCCARSLPSKRKRSRRESCACYPWCTFPALTGREQKRMRSEI